MNKQNKISQNDKCSYLPTSIKAIYGNYGNRYYNKYKSTYHLDLFRFA